MTTPTRQPHELSRSEALTGLLRRINQGIDPAVLRQEAHRLIELIAPGAGLDLMRDAPTGSAWFDPPKIFTQQANTPWHDKKNPGNPAYDDQLKSEVLDRILAVLVGRSYFVVDNGICDPTDFNWLSRQALGFGEGLLDLAARLGAERCHALCTKYAARFKGFDIPRSIREKRLAAFTRNLKLSRDGELAELLMRRHIAASRRNMERHYEDAPVNTANKRGKS